MAEIINEDDIAEEHPESHGAEVVSEDDIVPAKEQNSYETWRDSALEHVAVPFKPEWNLLNLGNYLDEKTGLGDADAEVAEQRYARGKTDNPNAATAGAVTGMAADAAIPLGLLSKGAKVVESVNDAKKLKQLAELKAVADAEKKVMAAKEAAFKAGDPKWTEAGKELLETVGDKVAPAASKFKNVMGKADELATTVGNTVKKVTDIPGKIIDKVNPLSNYPGLTKAAKWTAGGTLAGLFGGKAFGAEQTPDEPAVDQQKEVKMAALNKIKGDTTDTPKVQYALPSVGAAETLIPEHLRDKPFNAAITILQQTSPAFRAASAKTEKDEDQEDLN